LAQGLGDYLFGLETRDRHYGSLVGVRFREALITDRLVRLRSMKDLLTL